MPTTKKIAAVDFDRVIHRYSNGWQDGSIYDSPVENSRETLGKLVGDGWKIIIFTARLNPNLNGDPHEHKTKIIEWLNKNGFIEGQHYHDITATKPLAEIFIDDKAEKFTNWNSIFKKLG
jgi:hypothetical protein